MVGDEEVATWGAAAEMEMVGGDEGGMCWMVNGGTCGGVTRSLGVGDEMLWRSVVGDEKAEAR